MADVLPERGPPPDAAEAAGARARGGGRRRVALAQARGAAAGGRGGGLLHCCACDPSVRPWVETRSESFRWRGGEVGLRARRVGGWRQGDQGAKIRRWTSAPRERARAGAGPRVAGELDFFCLFVWQ